MLLLGLETRCKLSPGCLFQMAVTQRDNLQQGLPLHNFKSKMRCLSPSLEKHRDGICAQAFTIVNFSITTDIPKDAQAVVIYIVDESSQSILARAIALPKK